MDLRRCHHGSPAERATVVDVLSPLPYGVIHGPVKAADVALLVTYRREEVAEHGLPERFMIGLIHADGCRTEIREGDDPALDIPADQVGVCASWTVSEPNLLQVAQALLEAVLVIKESEAPALIIPAACARDAYQLALRVLVGAGKAPHVMAATVEHELPLQVAVNSVKDP